MAYNYSSQDAFHNVATGVAVQVDIDVVFVLIIVIGF